MEKLKEVLQKKIDSGEFSVRELASLAECSHQCVYDILKGTHTPKITVAERLLRVCGATLEVKTTKSNRKKISA
jgi:predicted transcriptional regulator